jgi:hypothetical protein
METPARYSYEPFSTTDSIRLITLMPGTGHEQLKCTLNKVTLDESLKYEAISYVWGDEANPVSIVCGDFGRTFCITQNLATVLFRFRIENEPRVLWADAICINQEDITERGYQITLMGMIYRQASHVLIWLGEEDEYTEVVFHRFAFGTPKLSEREVVALELFFSRPWFHRAWTFQEIRLAQHGIFHCGSYSIHNNTIYQSVRTHLDWIKGRKVSHKLEQNLNVSSMMTCPAWYYTGRTSLLEMAIRRRGSQCKDPRDLIY